MSATRVRYRRKAKDAASACIVIGLDFGTTYSGVAWVVSTSPSDINVLSAWDNTTLSSTYDSPKAPSKISYDGSSGNPSNWGYGASELGKYLHLFKLLLIDDDDLPAELRFANDVRHMRNEMREANKEPVEVVSDYLKFLWQHTVDAIEDSIGRTAMAQIKFRLVVTVPAIWPMYAQLRMTDAIKEAGMLEERIGGRTPLSFISEPEAAALATMKDANIFAELRASDITEKDSVVICDAGGGTVDLITYTVENRDPLVVSESAKGDGKLCGAMFLDKAFLEMLRKRIPKSIWQKMGTRGVRAFMHQYWEHGIKKQVAYQRDWVHKEWCLPLAWGGTFEDGFHSPDIKITQRQIGELYRPVVDDICGLVRKQISEVQKRGLRAPKYVILVGGLGSSRYLAQYMREFIKGTIILQSRGERPWSAVCRGAVLKGLAEANLGRSIGPSVRSRVSRYHVGTVFNVHPWEAHVHDIRDKAWCPVNQDFLAVDQVRWFAAIGDEIFDEDPIKHTFWQDVIDFDSCEDISTEIVYSEEIIAPRRCDRYVKNLCTITWSKAPDPENLPVWINLKGERVCRVAYEVCMVSDGVSLDFAVYHNKKRVASKNVSIDFGNIGVGRAGRDTPVDRPEIKVE